MVVSAVRDCRQPDSFFAFSVIGGSGFRPIFVISPIVLLVLLVVMRMGYIAAAKWGFILFFWGYLLIQVAETGGIYSNLYFWFFFYLVFAGSIFRLSIYYGLAALFAVQTCIYMVLSESGLIPTPAGITLPSLTYALNYILFTLFISMLVHITRRSMATTIHRLHYSEHLYENVIRDQTDYISRFKPDGTRILVNEAYCKSRESDYESIMQEDVFEAAQERGMLLRGVLALLTEDNPIGRHTIKRAMTDGTEVWEEWVNRAIFDGHGNVVEYQAVGRDITAQKMLEHRDQQLKLVREREAFLQEFVTNVSHDLKTPLSVMHTSLYFLGKARSMDDVQRRIGIMRQQTDTLESMIGDILAMSALEYVPHLEKAPTDLTALIQDTIRPLRVKAESKGITLTTDMPPRTVQINLNEEEIHRALLNLLDNALNYTPESSTVKVTLTAQTETVTLTITDTGIGIPPEDLPHIFERTYRGNNANEMHTGTGIGLAIVKKIVELHNGTISVQSTMGEGTTFTVVLPCNPDNC
ncbi:MAG: PAS domain-containing sensor histidine kinase [Chloroflexota bacterium]